MAKQDLDRLLRLLPALTAQEKAQAATQLKALTQFDQAASPGSNIDEDLVLESVHEVLANRGVDFTPPSIMRRRSRGFTVFQKKLPAIMQFIRQATNSRQQERWLLCKGVEALYDHLVGLNVPVSHATILRNIHSVPAVINRAYPGYVECGLLSWAVRGRANGHSHRA